MKRRAAAYANNDIGLVCWEYERRIDGCLGFAVWRIDRAGRERALPASVGFEGQTVPRDAQGRRLVRDTTVWPVQRFKWRDLSAPRGGTYRYRIVPMVGDLAVSDALRPVEELAVDTESVGLRPDLGRFRVYFNRGLVSTQALAQALPPRPDGSRPTIHDLVERIGRRTDPLRARLSGDIELGLFRLLDRAKREGGSLLAALYELEDDELEEQLIGVADRLQLILCNTGDDDRRNAAARRRLKEAGVTVHDRMLQGLSNNAIGHNKFLVLRDRQGVPTAVMTGSTNWTSTGLCTQTNNAVVVESKPIARAYADYWVRLLAAGDQQPFDGFRADNAQPAVSSTRAAETTVWFAPNTRPQRKTEAVPPDLRHVYELIDGAREMILFLLFRPGAPSIVDRVAAAQSANPDLVVYGAATDRGVRAAFGVNLVHRDARRPANHVVTAFHIKDDFAYWQRELSSGGHAVIHDKVLVIDPLSEESCAVVTGSHNLGFKASYSNDENLLVVRRNRRVATAFATHLIDVYDHFRWRFLLQEDPRLAESFGGLERTPAWQDKYFRPGSRARKELAYWLAGVPFTG